MKSFIVDKNENGLRLDKYVQKVAPSLPKSLMFKFIRTKNIKVNNKKVDNSTRLNEDDEVKFFINDEFFFNPNMEYKFDFLKAGKDIDIVYEDENIIVLNKSVGLLCHPEKGDYNDNLLNRMKRYLYEKKEFVPDNETSFSPALCNRIDRNTCGLVIGAKNGDALRIINSKIKNKEIKKSYYCLVEGVPNIKSAQLHGYLIKNEEKNTVKVFDVEKPGSKEIITSYKVIKSKDNISLLEVDLKTGRTHQIRAHLAHIGHPLVGDTKYGGKENIKYKHQALCSYKLSFEFNSSCDLLDYLNGKTFELKNIPIKI